MARLIKARHDVYGVVEVPETYLRMWPEAYKPLEAEQPEQDAEASEQGTPEDSSSLDEANRDA